MKYLKKYEGIGYSPINRNNASKSIREATDRYIKDIFQECIDESIVNKVNLSWNSSTVILSLSVNESKNVKYSDISDYILTAESYMKTQDFVMETPGILYKGIDFTLLRNIRFITITFRKV